MIEYSGSCLCGSVKFKVTGPVKFVAHDHCSICRKAHGATFVTWCGVKSETEQFQLLSGNDCLTSYQSTKEAERQFCKICGSQMFFRSNNWPGEVHFTRASIDQEMFEKPKAHVYYSDKASWLEYEDELPKYGGVTGTEPMNED